MTATPTPRLVVAGTHSSVGKTTVTLALTRALQARGLRVAAFKCGPDYLDPTHHARATGMPCHNLDGWMMGRTCVRDTFARLAAGADIALIEGVMGLYDGAAPDSEAGSTAQVAKWLDAPVLLVVDAGGMARTIAAIAAGMASFDPEVRLRGLWANRVGSANHVQLLAKACRAARTVPVVGGLPKQAAVQLGARHLGLHASDASTTDAQLDALGEQAQAWAGDLVALCGGGPIVPSAPAAAPGGRPCRIAYARDAAFSFYYDDNLRRLEALGATLVPFSPMVDRALPAADGLMFGGGYPELHAPALALNHAMRASVRAFAGPIYAECGGLMYLCRALRDQRGVAHPMVGRLDAEAHMCSQLQTLGYVEVETTAPSVLGNAGLRFRGHQFRYSKLVDVAARVQHVYRVRKRRGGAPEIEGLAAPGVLASYVHAHWASNPEVAAGLVHACRVHQAA